MMSFSVLTGGLNPGRARYAFKSAFSSYMKTVDSVSLHFPAVSISTGSTRIAPSFFIPSSAPSITLSTASLNPKVLRTTPTPARAPPISEAARRAVRAERVLGPAARPPAPTVRVPRAKVRPLAQVGFPQDRGARCTGPLDHSRILGRFRPTQPRRPRRGHHLV